MKLCPNCSAQNGDGDLFCGKCGQRLDGVSPDVETPAPVQEEPRPVPPPPPPEAPAPQPAPVPPPDAPAAQAVPEPAKPKRRHPVVLVLAVLLVLAAAGAAVGFYFYSQTTATTMSLMRTEGTVDVSNGKGTSVALRENLKLYSGYGVRTRPVSYAWINLDDVKLTKMDESSAVEIQKTGNDLRLEVNTGSLFFNVTEPLAEDETMSIHTSTMMVGIRGTRGWVSAVGQRRSCVYILEGEVEASAEAGGETARVSIGKMAEVLVADDGKAEITVRQFAEEEIPAFILAELDEAMLDEVRPFLLQYMTDEELAEQFQIAFDTCGGARNQGEEQIALELETLLANTADSEKLLPEDYEERYRTWREETIAALEAAAAQLQAEYDAIIAGRAAYDYVSGGMFYADYLDFEGDGDPELLLLTWDRDSVTAEVYGNNQWHAAKCGEFTASGESYPTTLSLTRSGDRLYLGSFSSSYAAAYFVSETYYGIDGGMLVTADEIRHTSDGGYEPGTQREDRNTSFDTEITASEFNAISAKYVTQKRFAEYWSGELYFDNRGLLSGNSGTALLDALGKSGAAYAMLADMDGDGVEDLLVLRQQGYSYVFQAHLWDGTAVRTVDLDQYVNNGEANGIYRDKTTGEIYVSYEAYGDATLYFLESLTDSAEYLFQSVGPDDPEERQLEVDEYNQALRAEMDERFELIDEAYGGRLETVNQVRQQLRTR